MTHRRCGPSPSFVLGMLNPRNSELTLQKLRYKLLKLGEDTWRERRYFEPDLEALLEAN